MANATGKQTLGQASEVLFMLAIPFFLHRLGMKATLLIGMLAWAVRYVLFAFGNADDLVPLLLIGIALHGVCYDFFFVSGQIYTDSKAGERYKSSAQGMITLATYGLGMLIGFHAAGAISDMYVDGGLHDWRAIWLYPAGFAALVFVLFALTFKDVAVEYRKPPRLAAAVIQKDFQIVMQPQERGGQVCGHGAFEKSRDDRLFSLSGDQQQYLSRMQDVARSRASCRMRAWPLGAQHRVLKRFLRQLRDVAMGLQVGARLVETDMAILSQPENAEIDRAMAFELRAYPAAFPYRIGCFRVEGDVALRRDREWLEKPALEKILATLRHRSPAARSHSSSFTTRRLRKRPGVSCRFPDQLLIEPCG